MAIDILTQQKTDIIYRDVNIASFKNVDLSDIHININILDTYWDNILRYLFDYCVNESKKIFEPNDYTFYSVLGDDGEFHKYQMSEDMISKRKSESEKCIGYYNRIIEKSINNQLPDNIKPCNIYYFNDDITTFIINFSDTNCVDNDGIILSINIKIYTDDKIVDINHPSIFFADSLIDVIQDKNI